MSILQSGNSIATNWAGDGGQTIAADFGSTQASALIMLALTIRGTTIAPAYITGLTDNRGNVWKQALITSWPGWADTADLGGSDYASTLSVHWCYDTASPAAGYTISVVTGSLTHDDSGALVAAPVAGVAAVVARFSGVNTGYPFDLNANGAHYGYVDRPNGGGNILMPQVSNIYTNTSDICPIYVQGNIGQLQRPSSTTNMTNNGVVTPSTVILGARYSNGNPEANVALQGFPSTAPGHSYSGPLNNAVFQNQNSVNIAQAGVIVLTSENQPANKRSRSRVIT